MASFAEDEYRLRGRKLTGWAFDIGSHIGVIAAALLSRNPDLRVIAVEPLPGNLEMIARNLGPFGERAQIVAGAAGNGKPIEIGYAFGGIPLPADYATSNHFIGRHVQDARDRSPDAELVTVQTFTLAGLMKAYGIKEVALIKTDCEGGEYPFFADRTANAKVHTIVGEWHDDDGSRIRKLLAPTHDFIRHEPSIPGSKSCTGLFEAVRRGRYAPPFADQSE